MATLLDVRQSLWRATASMIGSTSNMTGDSLFANIDAEMGILFEDRNAKIANGGTLSLSTAASPVLSFSATLNLILNQRIAGGSPTVVSLGSSSQTFTNNGDMMYATVNRVSNTATITVASTLPSATFGNQEIYLIAKRSDDASTKKVYLRDGTAINAGQSVRLGETSATDTVFSIGNASDYTKQIVFSASGSSTASTLTLAAAVTTNRTITFPDATDTVAVLAATQALSNKQIDYSSSNDSTTTGTAATLAAFTTGIVRVTNASLLSLSGIPAGTSGQQLIINNETGAPITINNEDTGVTAANRIRTGIGGAVSMFTDASFVFTYDASASRWDLTGGTGSNAGSGAKNYLSAVTTSQSTTPNTGNGNFELGSTTGWSLAKTALNGSLFPTSVGTGGNAFSSSNGGSAVHGTFTVSTITSGQLAGSYSASLADSAAGEAGDMLISNSFFIDTEDQNKILNFSFSYTAHSGTQNFSGTFSNTWAVYIYDVTNNAWIQPVGVYNMVVGSGIGYCTGSFQTTNNSTKYQLALIEINAPAAAFSLYVDDFVVGPAASVFTASTTSTGAVSFMAGSPTGTIPTTATLAVVVFTGVFHDTNSAYNTSTGFYTCPVSGYYKVTGDVNIAATTSITTGQLQIVKNNSTQLGIVAPVQAAASRLVMSCDSLVLCNAGDTLSLQINNVTATGTLSYQAGTSNLEINLVGTSVNAGQGIGANGTIAFAAQTTTGQTVNSTATTITFGTLITDTNSQYNGSNTYTIPVSGIYNLSAFGYASPSANNAGTIFANIDKNGSVLGPTVGTQLPTAGGQFAIAVNQNSIRCNAGDTITFVASQNTGTTVTYTGVFSVTLVGTGVQAVQSRVYSAPSVSSIASSTTYNVPVGALYVKVKMIGGGGGGGGSTSATAGGTGGSTSITATGLNLVCTGGGGGGIGNSSSASPAAGTVTSTTGASVVYYAIAGGRGTGGSNAANSLGPNGGCGPFGGNGGGGGNNNPGTAAAGNTGAGGGGAGANNATTGPGGSGSAGGYLEVLLEGSVIASSNTFTVTIGGSGGAGSGTPAGGAGATGYVEIWAFYQ